MKFSFRRSSAAAAPSVDASVDTGTVRQRFNFDWAMDPDNGVDQDTYWWWAISIRVDPSEVIAEDEEGNLWLVPFSTDGEDEVTFGDPVRVRETFVPVAASEGVAATAVVNRRRQRVLAAGLERPDKPERTTTAASERPDSEEEQPMARSFVAALRERLGISAAELPDDATDDQITEALGNEEPTPDEQPPDEEPSGNGGGSEEEQPDPEPQREDLPAAASTPAPGTVVVDEERLARLEADAAERRTQERDRIVDAAIADGRFMPSRRDHYINAWEADPDGTRHLLTADAADGGLARNTVPVHQRGTSTTTGDPGYDRVRASMGLPARKES